MFVQAIVEGSCTLAFHRWNAAGNRKTSEDAREDEHGMSFARILVNISNDDVGRLRPFGVPENP